MSKNIDDYIIPLEDIQTVIPPDVFEAHGESPRIGRELMIFAIEAIEQDPREASESWKTLLMNARSFDWEVSRSVYYHFLLRFPLCHTIRAQWMRVELQQLVRLSQALSEKKHAENKDAIYREANTCCFILSFQFQNWCDGSYSVDMWFLRMLYSTFFKFGDIFSSHTGSNDLGFSEYATADIDSIIQRAIEETTHDASAAKIWYFWVIREDLQSTSKEENSTLFKIIHKLLDAPLAHNVQPIFENLHFSFDEVKFVSSRPLAEIFPDSVVEFQEILSKTSVSISEILDNHKRITEGSSIPGSKLSLENSPKSVHSWVNLINIEAQKSSTQSLLGLTHSMLSENPFSESLCLFACYSLKKCLDHAGCIDIFSKIVNQSPSSIRPIIAILLSNEYFQDNNTEEAIRVLDVEIRLIRSKTSSSTDDVDIRDTQTMLNMQKMFLLYRAAEKNRTVDGVVDSKALKPVREAVMQAVKSGVFSWHIFVYLCVLEVQWSRESESSDLTRRMVTNIINQAGQHAGKSVEFLHRMVDFLPTTHNTADVMVSFEKMVKGFPQQSSSIQTGAIRSVWGRFYQLLKDVVPPWELEAYELRRDRQGYGYGGLIAEKSWSGDGMIEKDENENLPLSALQSLVLSSGPAGYLSLVNRYTVNVPGDTEPPMAMLSAQEHEFLDMKQKAWMHCLENDEEVRDALRKIGLRPTFAQDKDYAKISRTLSAPKISPKEEEIQRFLPFVLESVQKK